MSWSVALGGGGENRRGGGALKTSVQGTLARGKSQEELEQGKHQWLKDQGAGETRCGCAGACSQNREKKRDFAAQLMRSKGTATKKKPFKERNVVMRKLLEGERGHLQREGDGEAKTAGRGGERESVTEMGGSKKSLLQERDYSCFRKG